MKFLCDIALPNSVEVFSQYGEVALKNGRQINADDLVDVDVLIIRSITKVNEDLLVADFNSKYYDFDYNKLKKEGNYDCLHADSRKGMLRNDEIIVYREDQVNIRYLVELK